MKPARIIVIAVAAVSAIGLALVVRTMTSGGDAAPAAAASPAPEIATSQVLVAARDLEIGDRIENADMEWRAFPQESVNAAWIVEGASAIPTEQREGEAAVDAAQPSGSGGATAEVQRTADRLTGGGIRAQVVGAVVRERIMAGEPIVARKLVRAGQSGYLAVVLSPGMRAMALRVSAETGAGGFILPGDRVDVIMSRRAEAEVDGQGGYVTATVLRNVKVLAMGEVTEVADGEQTVAATTATLEVTGRDAELLAFAQAQGDLYLVLRSYADAAEPSGGAIQQAASPTERSVRVFRNGEATVVPLG
ncbi:Flp pilus assembly protein CpaB [Brevundimonas sp.]|uniref:Flp pilus assembly protein CpaB n=1 Tax=Brevundimonas sp. TaxID=1871086 RepID=UPI0025ED343C|nr:Flp pilus assembly protein CpaB [Brevundimonas sp.]